MEGTLRKRTIHATPKLDLDIKISHLMRVLSRVESKESFLNATSVATRKLSIPHPEDRRYVVRNFGAFTNYLTDAIKGLTADKSWRREGVSGLVDVLVKLHLAIELEGYVDKIPYFLVDVVIMTGRKEGQGNQKTLRVVHDVLLTFIDKVCLSHVDNMKKHVHKGLERVDSPGAFKILCVGYMHCIGKLANWEAAAFGDFVDVVIGWMVDEKVGDENGEFCREFLKHLQCYFNEDPGFVVALMEQITLDTETEVGELVSGANYQYSLTRTMLLARAYTAVLNLNCIDDKPYICSLTERMIAACLKMWEVFPEDAMDSEKQDFMELLRAINEAISITPGLDGEITRAFIGAEIDQLKALAEGNISTNYAFFISIWEGVCVWLEGAISSTALSDETLQIAGDMMKLADDMREGRERVKVVHALFRTRHVQLLQRVYHWHIEKLSDHRQVPFVVAGLVDIVGNRGSSILVLHALEPSMLNLLTDLATKETRHHVKMSILNMLKCHCSANSHWLSSLTTCSQFSTVSPGANLLAHLLSFWQEQLFAERDDDDALKEKLWLLDWISEFFEAGSPYAATFCQAFKSFIERVITFTTVYDSRYHMIQPVRKRILRIGGRPRNHRVKDSVQDAVDAIIMGEGKADTGASRVCAKEENEERQEPEHPEDEAVATASYWRVMPWPFLKTLNEILSILMGEGSKYRETDEFQSMMNTILKGILFGHCILQCHPDVVERLLEAFSRLRFFVIAPRIVPVISYVEDMVTCISNTCRPPMKHADYNSHITPLALTGFIYELLGMPYHRPPGEPLDCLDARPACNPAPTPALVRAAVDYLVRNKLRSVLGKPTELFSCMQNRISAVANLEWKLDFLFALEQALILLGSGSYLRSPDLLEPIVSFYVANRGPCAELLRRMRSDLITWSYHYGNYHHAYYQATMAAETSKVEACALQLKDANSFKGASYYQRIAWHYLHGNFEKAMSLLEEESESSSDASGEVISLIGERCAQLLSMDFTEILPPDGSEFTGCHSLLKAPADEDTFSFLDKQILHIQKNEEIRQLKSVLEIPSGVGTKELDHWSLLKLCDVLRTLPSIPMDQRRETWIMLAEKMLHCENYKFTKNLLSQLGVNWEAIRERVESNNFMGAQKECFSLSGHSSIPEFQRKRIMLLSGELLLNTNDLKSSSLIYSSLLSETSCFKDYAQNGCLLVVPDVDHDLEWSSKVIMNIAGHFHRTDHFLSVMNNIGLEDPSEGCSLPFDISSKDEVIRSKLKAYIQRQVLLEKALDLAPLDSSIWLALGNAYFEFAQSQPAFEDRRSLNKKSFDAFCNHLRFAPSSKKKGNGHGVVRAISRVITMIQNGHRFDCDPKEVIVDYKWLSFLPEVAQTPYLRPFILYRFPQIAAMYLWSYSSNTDTSVLSVPKWTPEKLPSTGLLSTANSSSLGLPSPWKQSDELLLPKSPLEIDPRIDFLANELLRIGTSYEDLWSWVLQRVVGDWSRRVNALKKVLERDPDSSKITTYTTPILNFLQSVWEYTMKNATSPVQLSFVAKATKVIPNVLDTLKHCTTIETLRSTFEELLLHVETLESHTDYKMPLELVSPGLFTFQNWGNGLTVPGMPIGVSIVGITSMVLTLPTKTRPKKIRFHGSNGKYYEYLVKGNENLNVDAAMMQLFSLCQSFIEQPIWTYAVTPLGNRGGLIQIVQPAVPVFRLYRSFLNKAYPTEKASEIFWKKAQDLGVNTRERSSLNNTMLRSILSSLKDEVPRDLIARELLLCAETAQAWYRNVKVFTRDSGVTCAIGYMIGIGDRHLDNILISPEEGKLIHVDFSLVFWRGEKLRVPERVPFRLTQNFAAALQHPGVRGPYSSYMEDTITRFLENLELGTFCAKTVAFAMQLNEDHVLTREGPLATLSDEEILSVNPLELKLKSQIHNLVTKFRNKISGFNTKASVESLIQDATSDSNLSLMYEGWTPWV